MTFNRRTFVSSAAGFGAALFAADWALVDEALAHAARAVEQQPPPPFTTLTPDEARELAAVVERIMPTTETPGAREAGVIHFVDRALGSFEKGALPDMRRGLADLRARTGKRRKGSTSFATLPPTDQDAILVAIEKTDFFRGMHFFTMVGMFGNPSWGGNRDAVGWKLLGFESHARHQPPFGYYDAQAAKER